MGQRFLILLFVLSALACEESGKKKRPTSSSIVRSPIEISYIGGISNFKTSDSIALIVSLNEELKGLQDITVFLNEDSLMLSDSFPFEIRLFGGDLQVGRNVIRVSASTAEKMQSKTSSFTLLPSAAPKNFTYRISGIHQHDDRAYTQGLFYHNGELYEGTGQKKMSSLRVVDLKTGKVDRIHTLEGEYFGEGVSLFGDKVYQLTWQSQIGFIYDLDELKPSGKFYYEGEGWGLTSDSVHLIRSDGSNKLFFHDPLDFKLIRSIEVCTDEGPLNKLNELEYIDGRIYANIYLQDKIAIINPLTGIVEGMVDLKGILSKNDRTSQTDVLNGIAYDALNRRIFVTGKYWSKLFEIEVVPPKES